MRSFKHGEVDVIHTQLIMHAHPKGGFYKLTPMGRKPDGIVFHHGGAADRLKSKESPVNQMLADNKFHVYNRHWKTIGYNYLIYGCGTVVRGRPDDTIGAHCPGENHRKIGIMIVIGVNETPTDLQIDRAIKLTRHLSEKHGFALTRQNIIGHRDRLATSCPGNFYKHIPHVIKEAQKDTEGNVGELSQGAPTDEKDHIFYEKAKELKELGIISGRSDGSFGLVDPITRGEAFAVTLSMYKALSKKISEEKEKSNSTTKKKK